MSQGRVLGVLRARLHPVIDGTGTWLVLLAGCLYLSGCSAPPTTRAKASPPEPLPSGEPQNRRVVRATGLIQALEWQSIRVPQLSGLGGRITLTRLIPNGAGVSKGNGLRGRVGRVLRHIWKDTTSGIGAGNGLVCPARSRQLMRATAHVTAALWLLMLGTRLLHLQG